VFELEGLRDSVKIVIAEKISLSAVEQLKEPGWTVLTADQLDGKLARVIFDRKAFEQRGQVVAAGAAADVDPVQRLERKLAPLMS